jgi:hypothetical protein
MLSSTCRFSESSPNATAETKVAAAFGRCRSVAPFNLPGRLHLAIESELVVHAEHAGRHARDGFRFTAFNF